MQRPIFKHYSIYVIAALFMLPNAHGQEPSRFLKWSYRDVGRVAQSVLPKAPVYAILGATTMATTIRLDEPFQDDVRETYTNTPFWQSYLDITNELGSPAALVPAAGLFTASLFTSNTRFQDAAFTSLQSWVYAGAMTFGLKRAFGRLRPEEGVGATTFKPFSRHTSFPSGHATVAFALITPWVYYYPNIATYSLLGISASTAIARMALDKHWPTDVLAGAAIGFFTGRFLAKMHIGETAGILSDDKAIQLETRMAPTGFAIALSW